MCLFHGLGLHPTPLPPHACARFSPTCLYFRSPATQNTRENNIRMFNDMRDAVDGVDPDRDTYAYSDK